MKMDPRHWLFHRVLLVEVREIIWYIFVVSALVPLWRDVARADTFHFLAILLPHSPFSTCTTFFFKAPKSSSSNISQTVSFSLHLNPLLHSDKERSTPMPMKNRPLWPLENVFRLIFLNFLRLLLRVEEVPLLLFILFPDEWAGRLPSLRPPHPPLHPWDAQGKPSQCAQVQFSGEKTEN